MRLRAKAFLLAASLLVACGTQLSAAPLRDGETSLYLGQTGLSPVDSSAVERAPDVLPVIPEALSPARLSAVKWGSGALSLAGLGFAAYGISETFQGMGNATDRSRLYGGLSCVVIGSVVAAIFGGVSSHYTSGSATATSEPR